MFTYYSDCPNGPKFYEFCSRSISVLFISDSTWCFAIRKLATEMRHCTRSELAWKAWNFSAKMHSQKYFNPVKELSAILSHLIWAACMYLEGTHWYQFGCGISKMVGSKMQDFWPRINILKGKKNWKVKLMNDGSLKIGRGFRK